MSTGGSVERAPGSGTNAPPTQASAGQAPGGTGVPLGTLIANKYRVERVLGEGAMGIVLAARHVELDELVAIKCIRAELPWSSDVLARFAREAKASARLKSEHVAKVIDVGVSAPVGPYMVMEYLEGEDLAALLRRRGPLPVRRAAEYVMQVCEALAVAHAASITHRDVKPENLFLTRHGDMEIIKVLDFGISKAPLHGRLFGGEMAVRETQSLMGTPLYMSPEQIRSTREVDHRSDLWSLGVVLFELLTGRPAFAGETVTQVCTLVLESSPPPLAEYCFSAPAGLAQVIERCLMKDPAQRFQSAAELANALLPFAPARARLHAERATSVLRAADPNDEGLPSTRPDGRHGRVQESSLETTAPTVLGAGVGASMAPRVEGQRALLAGLFLLVCLGLGFAAFRALFARPASDSKNSAAAQLSLPSGSSAKTAPSRDASEQAARDTAPLSATDAGPPHTTPVANAVKVKVDTRGRGKGRPSATPAVPKLAVSEPTPPPAESKRRDSEPSAAKPRVRLVDNGSSVKLLE